MGANHGPMAPICQAEAFIDAHGDSIALVDTVIATDARRWRSFAGVQ